MEPSPGRCKDHQFQESEQIRSLVFSWVCKLASQSTVVFSVSGIVELYPSITSRKTGGLEALLFLVNTASRRILWWTWIRCFFLFFTSSLVWWRISWRRCTKMVLASNTCLLCSQVLVLLSSKRAFLSDLRSEKCWRIIFVAASHQTRLDTREVLKDIDFEELLNLKELRAWEAFKSVCSGFLGNTRVPDYQAYIEKLLKSYEDMGCRMSLKIHFLHSYLNFFRQTLEQWVMSMEKDSTKTLRRWRATIKANGTPAWWETSAGCSCVTSREAKYTRSSRKTHFLLSVVLWIV